MATIDSSRASRTAPRPASLLFSFLILSCMVWITEQGNATLLERSGHVRDHKAEVPVAWFNLQMKLIETSPGFSPPVASRALAYSSVALYEALAPGMWGYQSLAKQLNNLRMVPQPNPERGYHWPTVANSALARITRELYPNATAEQKLRIDALEKRFLHMFKASVRSDIFTRSIAHGKAVADAIFEWSKSDGGHEAYNRNFPSNYTAPTGPGKWMPTPRSKGEPLSALQPYWGKNRPFILPTGNPLRDCNPGAPPEYSTSPSSDFYKEGLEVYNAVRDLTPEQQEIALFWADDPGKTCTPPGHSVSILTQCITMKKESLEFAAHAYAKMGIAVADAFIACWDAKYRYNVLRPITYIQQVIDPEWNVPTVTDPLDTPPFPEYPSGHSVQSGAAAQVLNALFGKRFRFTDHTHEGDGRNPRTFASFDQFASEAAISRLYGGIHYRSAIERGVDQGKKVGDAVLALKFKE